MIDPMELIRSYEDTSADMTSEVTSEKHTHLVAREVFPLLNAASEVLSLELSDCALDKEITLVSNEEDLLGNTYLIEDDLLRFSPDIQGRLVEIVQSVRLPLIPGNGAVDYSSMSLYNSSRRSQNRVISNLLFSVDQSKWNLIITSGAVVVGGKLFSVADQILDLTSVVSDLPRHSSVGWMFYLDKESVNGAPKDKILTSLPKLTTPPMYSDDDVIKTLYDILLRDKEYTPNSIDYICICLVQIRDQLPGPPQVIITYDPLSRITDPFAYTTI